MESSLHDLLAFESRAENICGGGDHFFRYLAYAGVEQLSPATIAQDLDTNKDAARQLLAYAVDFGVASHPEVTDSQVVVDRESAGQMAKFLSRFSEFATETERSVLAERAHTQVDMLVQAPSGVMAIEPEDGRLLPELASMIGRAERSVTLVTPFINAFGAETILDRLARAAGDGMEVTVITRDPDEKHEELDRLIDETESRDGEANLSIFEFGTDDIRLHAKAMVVDETSAYIGSANLTSYSLQESLELGVILHGPAVDNLVDLLARVSADSLTGRFY